MQTFLLFILILQAKMLTLLLSITSAYQNYPLAISAPKDIYTREVTAAEEFNLPFLEKIDGNGRLEFAPTNADEQIIIYACPAEWKISEKLKNNIPEDIFIYSLFVKIFKDDELKRCHSAIKPDFLVEPSVRCTKDTENLKYTFKGNIVYRFGYTKEYVINTNGGEFILDGIVICFNGESKKPLYMTYQLWKTMEDNLQNLNINDVEELSYNVSDSDLEKHLQGIHDAFKSQEEIGYVPHLLVPPDHLMFTRRNLAKHYLNVDLLHRELIPLINVIDKRIKEYAKLFSKDDFLTIFCLTTNIRKVSNNEQVNHEISKLVPHLWVKVIYNPTRNLAAVIYIHNSTIDYQDEKQCKDEKLCDFQEWAKDMTASNLLHQQAYCCAIDETSWLINVLPYDMKVDGFLNINQLQLPDTPEK